MTNEDPTTPPKADADFAQHIADTLKGQGQPGPGALGVPSIPGPAISTIPQHIANNLLEFLRRVTLTGMESVAWMEAYQYVQPSAQPQQKPGVPFTGLPTK
jgi:hypothetical protein